MQGRPFLFNIPKDIMNLNIYLQKKEKDANKDRINNVVNILI